MMLLPAGVKVHLAFGYTDMRKGIDGLAMLVQGVLRQDPFSGHLFVFRGRKANLIKIVFWDGTGLCLFTKRLEQGVFLWPSNVEPGGTLALNSEQLSMLIEGIDWRAPERRWRARAPAEGQMVLEAVERRFVWQARLATLLVAASSFYIVDRLDLWDRFRHLEFWWMHAMILLWLMIFTFFLFVAEPLAARMHRNQRARAASTGRLALMQWLHWVLLLLSASTILAAVAGSQGMSLVP
jgi:transposase